jgi:hypothetical protein
VSALAGTISAPFGAAGGGVPLSRWLRSALSLLVAVGVLAVALPVAFSSGAPGAGADSLRVLSSAPLVSVEAGGSAQLSVAGIVPGESRSADLRVTNGGGAAALSLVPHLVDRVGAGGARLSDALALRIESATGRLLYDGPVGRMPRLGLGEIAAGAERAYRFTVTLPGGVGNAVEGSSLRAAFAWTVAG